MKSRWQSAGKPESCTQLPMCYEAWLHQLMQARQAGPLKPRWLQLWTACDLETAVGLASFGLQLHQMLTWSAERSLALFYSTKPERVSLWYSDYKLCLMQKKWGEEDLNLQFDMKSPFRVNAKKSNKALENFDALEQLSHQRGTPNTSTLPVWNPSKFNTA